MGKYITTTGAAITAQTRAAAAAIAAQHGMGDLLAGAAPAKPAAPMGLEAARRLASLAGEWPRCGAGWPSGSRERAAAAALAAAGEDRP